MKKFLLAALAALMILFPAVPSARGQGMGGVSTGEAKTYTSRRTTGIVDPKAPVIYEDITAKTPLKDFQCVSGASSNEYILEATACTVAVFDYDSDGKPDIFLLNGSTIEAEQGKAKAPKSALYRNLGGWKFEDVTAKAGVANERWGMGVAVADYDNDGDLDLWVSNYGIPRLYRNNGDGTFTDVAEKLGLAVRGWHTGATFGDYDGDGRLDLFVPEYLDFDINKLPPSPLDVGKDGSVGTNYCQFRGQAVMCGPRGLKGGKDRLFHQKADGTFEESGAATGVVDDGNYYGFSSVFIDVDNDGDLDLLVVNDSTPKQLYINDGKGKFEEVGYPSGIALNENGREQAGMGLGVGDFNNDGLVDFNITNFSDDSNTLYRNDGDGNFTDVTFQAGLGEPTIPFLGWGTAFLDFDNDGWKDLVVANGHVYPLVDKFQWGTSFAQQILLFVNRQADSRGRVTFERVPAAPGSGLGISENFRGLAVADFDGDGRLDIITNDINSSPKLLRNVAGIRGNWIGLRLEGDVPKGTPADAIGSTVWVTVGDLKQRYDATSGASYASQSSQVIHVGIGAARKVDSVEVRWANGSREKFSVDGYNRTSVLKQGKGAE